MEGSTKRRTEITIETHRRVHIRASGPIEGWCGECAAQVPLLEASIVAQQMGIGSREVYRRVVGGGFYGGERPGGRVLIVMRVGAGWTRRKTNMQRQGNARGNRESH